MRFDSAGVPGLKVHTLPADERCRVRWRDPSGAPFDGTMEARETWAGELVGVRVRFDLVPGELLRRHPADLEHLGDAVRVIPPVPTRPVFAVIHGGMS